MKPFRKGTRILIKTMIWIFVMAGSQYVAAQAKKPGSWKIKQTETTSDSITIKGVLKTKGVAGWRVVPENVYISVSCNGLYIARDLQLQTPGEFSIKASLSDIENNTITVTVGAKDYSTIEIRNIKPKDTYLEVFTEKTEFRVLGE